MCIAQGPQHSDAGEARTRGPWVSSQALYHLATGNYIVYTSIMVRAHKLGAITSKDEPMPGSIIHVQYIPMMLPYYYRVMSGKFGQ